MEQILKLIQENQGLIYLAVFLAGGSAAWPLVKKCVAATPTKIDDVILQAVETAMAAKRGQAEALSMAELERRLTTPQIKEIVRLRKARLERDKAAPPG